MLGEGRHVVGPGAVDRTLHRVLRMQPRRNRFVEVFVDRAELEQRHRVVDAQHRDLLVRRHGEEPVGTVVRLDMTELEACALLAQRNRGPLHPRAGLETHQKIFRHDVPRRGRRSQADSIPLPWPKQARPTQGAAPFDRPGECADPFGQRPARCKLNPSKTLRTVPEWRTAPHSCPIMTCTNGDP